MQIIDRNMPYNQFLAMFDGIHAEWIDGVVYQLPIRSAIHQTVQRTLDKLLTLFLTKYTIGEHVIAPTVLYMTDSTSARCPDIQVLLDNNAVHNTGREIIGASDIVIEIISEHHHVCERGDKFIEYEQLGVGEYWIIDPIRQECLFYTLQSGLFRRSDPDPNGVYHSQRLPNFRLPIQFLWSEPTDDKIAQLIDSM